MSFHYLARAIIVSNGQILLAHQKGAAYTFLPGGHIEFGERAELALVREIAEEIGMPAAVQRFVGAVEGYYVEKDRGSHHEINLVFEVNVPELASDQPPLSREPHLEFLWSPLSDLAANNLLPVPMIACLSAWERGAGGFWGSAFD